MHCAQNQILSQELAENLSLQRTHCVVLDATYETRTVYRTVVTYGERRLLGQQRYSKATLTLAKSEH
jgi:hypothetical protein